jgi:acyl-CoA thioester hydrolase
MTAAAQGHVADGVHHFPIRVYYEDTDAAGIVYYANYLKFAERARTEMMRCLGVEHERMRRDVGITLAVRRATIDYLAPARLDDELQVTTRLIAAAGATVSLGQEVRRGAEVLARLELVVACLTMSGRPRRLPPALTAALASISRRDQQMVSEHAH